MPRPTFSRGIHSSGPPAPCLSTQKTHVRVERLLGSVRLQKECDRVTLRQVNKTNPRLSDKTTRFTTAACDLYCHVQSRSETAIPAAFQYVLNCYIL